MYIMIFIVWYFFFRHLRVFKSQWITCFRHFSKGLVQKPDIVYFKAVTKKEVIAAFLMRRVKNESEKKLIKINIMNIIFDKQEPLRSLISKHGKSSWTPPRVYTD